MRQYVTVFDFSYLAKGLALHASLMKHSSAPFCLNILPVDDAGEWMLRQLDLPNVNIIDRGLFERRMNLGKVRASRSHREYCWTLASQALEFMLWLTQNEITYLDADLFFFSDPEPVFAEIGDRSIAVTPHRLIPSKKHLEVNGLFNVGWVTFKYTEAGQACCYGWAFQCRQQCSATEGCGDQLYLDAWPAKYGSGLCQLGIGVNVAPWNVGNWTLTPGPAVDGRPIVCFHFHEYVHGERLTNYQLRDVDCDLIYRPYVDTMTASAERVIKERNQLQSERA